MNYENFNAALTHIERNPGEWDQTMGFLGHGHPCCLLGHAHRLSGHGWLDSTIKQGGYFVGADQPMKDWIYAGERTLDEFRAVRLALATARLIAA